MYGSKYSYLTTVICKQLYTFKYVFTQAFYLGQDFAGLSSVFLLLDWLPNQG